MRSQLDSLKNHLDPHFLFNNLNILAALIDSDQQASKTFIQKFAEVYRTLLHSKSGDLISLRDELDFIQSYIYLMKVRFQNLIELESNVSAIAQGRMLPPLTLQMLVENVVKHNAISERMVLWIDIQSQGDEYLSVKNTINLKKGTGDETSGTGLANIKQRYAHFTELPVKVLQSDSHFEVLVPLLKIEPSWRF